MFALMFDAALLLLMLIFAYCIRFMLPFSPLRR